MKYHDYLQTDYWKEVSLAVKKRAGWRCQVCNSPHDLDAHHRTYDHRGRELDHLDDLVCLCRRCHAVFHGKVETKVPPPKPLEVAQPARTTKAQRRAARLAAMGAPADPASDMPPGDGDIVLTLELVNRLRTRLGGFTGKTLDAVGIGRKPKTGWVNRLCGVNISRQDYQRALDGRTKYVKH